MLSFKTQQTFMSNFIKKQQQQHCLHTRNKRVKVVRAGANFAPTVNYK